MSIHARHASTVPLSPAVLAVRAFARMNDEDNEFLDEPVKIPLSDWLDLHTFSPGEIKDLLDEYLSECHKAGLFRVRIIHGKGTGTLRTRVHDCLQKNPLIERFYQAPAEAGGWGATIAVLRRAAR